MNLDTTLLLNKVRNLAKLVTVFKLSLDVAGSHPSGGRSDLLEAGGPFLSPRDGLVLLNRGPGFESSV